MSKAQRTEQPTPPKTQLQQSRWANLPASLLAHASSWLEDSASLSRVAGTCRGWRGSAELKFEPLWERLHMRLFEFVCGPDFDEAEIKTWKAKVAWRSKIDRNWREGNTDQDPLKIAVSQWDRPSVVGNFLVYFKSHERKIAVHRLPDNTLLRKWTTGLAFDHGQALMWLGRPVLATYGLSPDDEKMNAGGSSSQQKAPEKGAKKIPKEKLTLWSMEGDVLLRLSCMPPHRMSLSKNRLAVGSRLHGTAVFDLTSGAQVGSSPGFLLALDASGTKVVSKQVGKYACWAAEGENKLLSRLDSGDETIEAAWFDKVNNQMIYRNEYRVYKAWDLTAAKPKKVGDLDSGNVRVEQDPGGGRLVFTFLHCWWYEFPSFHASRGLGFNNIAATAVGSRWLLVWSKRPGARALLYDFAGAVPDKALVEQSEVDSDDTGGEGDREHVSDCECEDCLS